MRFSEIKFQCLLALLASPLIFGFCIHYFFGTNFQETLHFISLIWSHLMQKRMKVEVYFSLAYACTPFVLLVYWNFRRHYQSHGRAKWATLRDIAKMGLKLKKTHEDALLGFMLGRYKHNQVVVFDKPLACLVVAPPGAGKSQAVAIPNLLSIPQSCIVLDIKGELCASTAGYRQNKLQNKILIFDPMKNGAREAMDLQFNPFDAAIIAPMHINERVRLVNEIAHTIFVAKEKDHWIEQAKNLFIFYALYDLCTQKSSSFFHLAQATKRDFRKLIHPCSRFYPLVYEHDTNHLLLLDQNHQPIPNPERTLGEIEMLYYQQIAEQKYADIANENNYREESPESIEQNIQNGTEPLLETLRDTARQWAGTPLEEFGSIKSTYNRYMQVFTYNQVREATQKMSFAYNDLREQKLTIYIKIAQTDIETLAPLIRIFLESVGKNLLLKETQKQEEFVYFILDEFTRFGKLDFLMEMPALCRSYGIIPVYITQSYALIEKHYSREDLKIINETIAYKIIFKMNDADSAEMISKEIGDYTRLNSSKTTSKHDILTGGSTSTSKEAVRLVSPQDILNIPANEVLILVTGFKAKPLKLYANYAYEQRVFQERVQWSLQQKPPPLLWDKKPMQDPTHGMPSCRQKEYVKESTQEQLLPYLGEPPMTKAREGDLKMQEVQHQHKTIQMPNAGENFKES